MPPAFGMSYMNEPVRKMKITPSGWLVAPTRDFCLLFIRDPKAVMAFTIVFTELWYCTDQGIPTKLKNKRRLHYLSSHETWNELIGNGWELVEQQFNDYVDVA